MAEGYTQRFEIKKYVYNGSQSTPTEVYSEQLSFEGQNDIKEFVYLPYTLTFYNDYNNEVGNYNIDDIYSHNGHFLALDKVQWNGTDIQDGERYSGVPEWGGRFDIYYAGNFEPETTLTLSPSNLALYVGETGTITATTNSQQSITWNSNNTAIATVNSSGVVTAISAGTAIITASVETKTASCTVTVSAPSISEYTLNIYINESITDIIKSITIPKNEKINKYIYETGVYNDINTRDGFRDGYYISEWKNHDTDAIIQDTQTMVGDLDIYPGYTEIKTKYYSAVYLPDLTQRFPLGVFGTKYPLGSTGGQEDVKLTDKQCALPNHRHAVLVDTNATAAQFPSTLPNGTLTNSMNPTAAYPLVQTSKAETGYSKDTLNNHAPVLYTAGEPFAMLPHTNMPPYLTVNFIIKYK